MDINKERMVEIARFQNPSDAIVPMGLLEAAEIECYLRNEYSALILGGYADIGGARLEVLESNAERAIEIMELECFGKYIKRS